jgi:hypothetical protein
MFAQLMGVRHGDSRGQLADRRPCRFYPVRMPPLQGIHSAFCELAGVVALRTAAEFGCWPTAGSDTRSRGSRPAGAGESAYGR